MHAGNMNVYLRAMGLEAGVLQGGHGLNADHLCRNPRLYFDLLGLRALYGSLPPV